ncbi:MAG TPA: GWxTD domain-containing protein [Gemmatimonadales bacterium]|jgi:GWxTD domain-containing protein|nr:GWxTD domain-containing protein [Gemmatimonadales bacterium]
MLRCVLAVLALAVAPLAAQSPADRAALEALRDSLAAVADSVALGRLEAATIAVAKQRRGDPLIHLRLGFIAYRLGELAAKSHYDDAAGEFEWAAELRPEWPYPWYGLGLAELALGEHAVLAIENLRQMLGKDYLSKAAKAFARATEADPGFASAVVDLANTALTQRIRPRLEVALGAVRLAAASPAGRNAQVQLVRGRVEREAGEADSALAGFRGYLAVGGDSGVGLLEVARTYYFARRPADGWREYFAGARAATSAPALTMYRTDLAWIADSAELAAFDALPDPAARVRWLDAFWTRRDVVEAREVGERLAEHYRRWFYARRSFRLVSRHRHYDITEVYRARQAEFDDRGVIYLRHGEPDRRARFVCSESQEANGEGCAANESWLYRREGEGGDLIFHFAARGDVQDFKLVESLVDVLGFRRAVRATSFADPEVSQLYASRDEFGPLYARVGHGLGTPASELSQDRARGRRNIRFGTTSDSYAQRFELPLDVVASEFVAGAEGEPQEGEAAQTLHVVFAIPGERLLGEQADDGLRYPLHFRLVVSDSADRIVARLDTLRVFASRQALRNPAYLTGRLAVAVPPGRYRYRLLVATPNGEAGDVVRVDSLDVSALDGRRFAVSDVVVGRAGSGLVWLPPGDTVRLNPLNRFPEGSGADLYYELYGLPRGAPYHTVVRLEREGGRSLLSAIRGLFGGNRAPVLLEFDAAAEGPVTRVHRAVELRDVGKGTYRLTVIITDPSSGSSVTRTRRFQVVAR